MFYEWLLEIVNRQSGEMRNLTYQGNLKEVFNYLKKLEENQWELLKVEKNGLENESYDISLDNSSKFRELRNISKHQQKQQQL